MGALLILFANVLLAGVVAWCVIGAATHRRPHRVEDGLAVWCNWCQAPITEPGGLVFGPPDGTGRCLKRHICRRCYDTQLP